MRGLRVTIAALVAAAAAAGSAGADGLPVGGLDVGPSGVILPGDDVRYVALRAGPNTLVARVEQPGGRVLGTRLLDGRFTIPAVALDGSAGGLAADGERLVLIRPRAGFPRKRTVFAVVDTSRAPLRLRETVVLPGDFSFDALSPDGSLLYLVEYVDPDDPTRYVVRGYDLAGGRLLPEPVVDPKVFGDVMRGYPVTRTVSLDGRWAYTLYDGGGDVPFVHALDTAEGTAACIAVEALAGYADLLDARLAISGGEELRVVAGAETAAIIDTASLRLREPPPSPAPASLPAGRGDASAPWALVAGVAVLLLAGAAAAVLVQRRRRRLAAT